MKRTKLLFGCLTFLCCIVFFNIFNWNYILFHNSIEIEDIYLQIDPFEYNILELEEKYREKFNQNHTFTLMHTCTNADCEFWNFLATYLLDPNYFTRMEQIYHYLCYPVGFFYSLSYPPINFNDILSLYYIKKDNSNEFIENSKNSMIIKNSKILFYLHSGADLIHAYVLNPNAEQYILLSPEYIFINKYFDVTKKGNIGNVKQDTLSHLDVILPHINSYLLELCGSGITRNFNYLGNVYPYILAQLKLIGFVILEVHELSHLPFDAVEFIVFDNNDNIEKKIYYISSSLSDINLEHSFFKNLSNPFTLLMNNHYPGYFQHHYELLHPISNCTGEQDVKEINKSQKVFQQLNILLEYSNIIIQEDHAIPHHLFYNNMISEYSWDHSLEIYGNIGALLSTNSYYTLEVSNLKPSQFFISKEDRYKWSDCTNDCLMWFINDTQCIDENCICKQTNEKPYHILKNSSAIMILAKSNE